MNVETMTTLISDLFSAEADYQISIADRANRSDSHELYKLSRDAYFAAQSAGVSDQFLRSILAEAQRQFGYKGY